jgi:hypothetical protein
VRYTISWSRRALDAMARAWLDHPENRTAIAEAVNTADDLFSIDPVNQGEFREESRRVVFIGPLVLTISVDVSKHVVRVLNVRHPQRRGSA